MSRDTFTPHLYIGIGETEAFFTLRETYLHSWRDAYGDHTEVRSFHHCNLAQDPTEAYAKAVDRAIGMELQLTSTLEGIQREMREIKRATAEQLARREAELRERQAKWEAERQERNEQLRAMIDDGIMPLGRYRDTPFSSIPTGYIEFLATTEFEEGSIFAYAGKYARNHPELRAPQLSQVHIGEVGQRLTMKVEVIRVFTFTRPMFNAPWRAEAVFIVTMRETDSGACVVCKSTTFCPDEREKLVIKATVKEHGEYKGQNQTLVNRVKIISEEM